jgi:glycosyltransferase involved in cell wall biosynthesis
LATRAVEAKVGVEPVRMRGEWDLAAVARLRRLMGSYRPDVIHAHTAHAHTLVGLARGCRLRPAVVVSRRVDFHLHGGPAGRWKYKRLADCIVPVSDGVRRVLVSDGLDPRTLRIVHSGVDVEKFGDNVAPTALRRELGLDPHAPLIGNIAALVPHKDHATLLRAARLVADVVPRVHWVIAGIGPLEAELRELAAELGLAGSVTFLGFRHDVANVLAALDVFALSSAEEGLCTSLLDAMLLERAVVATRVGGVPEVVVDGVTGRLVPARDPAPLAAAILALLAAPENAARMGRAGRARVLAQFDLRQTVHRTLTVYEEVLAAA